MTFPELAQFADWGLLALRLVLGAIFIVHGWPKLTNARGMVQAMGQASGGAVAFFTAQGAVELLGGLALIAGVWVQIVAILFAFIMVGAIGLKNSMMKTGFMAQQTTGWEFDLINLAACLVLLFQGAGHRVSPRGVMRLDVAAPRQRGDWPCHRLNGAPGRTAPHG